MFFAVHSYSRYSVGVKVPAFDPWGPTVVSNPAGRNYFYTYYNINIILILFNYLNFNIISIFNNKLI